MSGLVKLDLFTVVVCAHLTLALMCAALFVARPIPTQPSRTMRLWLLSVVAFLLAGGATAFAQRVLHLSPFDPITVSMVAVCLSTHGVLQWFAVEDVKGLRFSRTRITTVTLLAALISVAVPSFWALTSHSVSAWPTFLNVVALLAVMPTLPVMARQGFGGRALGVSLLLQMIPNLAALTGVIDLHRGDLPLLIAGNLATLSAATLSLLLWHQGRMEDLLARSAMTDALTGALNRHGLNQRLNAELARSQREQSPLSVVLCDLDHFKAVNDTHGHEVGDQVLRQFVANANRVLRKSDCVGRWGGEEFMLVLPDTALQHAVAVAERMRATPVVVPGVAPVTFSAGVATAGNPGCGYDLNALFACADRHLYVAKETRDRVVAMCSANPSATVGVPEPTPSSAPPTKAEATA